MGIGEFPCWELGWVYPHFAKFDVGGVGH